MWGRGVLLGWQIISHLLLVLYYLLLLVGISEYDTTSSTFKEQLRRGFFIQGVTRGGSWYIYTYSLVVALFVFSPIPVSL